MKNHIERIVIILTIILCVYYFASLLEMASQNCWYDPVYSKWNIIYIFDNIRKSIYS